MTDFDPLTGERRAALVMSDAKSSEELLDRLVALVDSLCDELLAQHDLTPMQIVGVQRTRTRVPGAIAAYKRWVSLFPWSEEQTQNALFLLATMVDNLLCLGSLAMRDPHSAAMVESIVSGGQRGGQNSGVTRQGQAASDEAIIEGKANRIRAAHPSWSQDDVATDIAALWPVPDKKPPGHTKIKSVLSRLEKTGRLPRRRPAKSVNEGG